MKQQNLKQNIMRVLALCICIIMCFTLGACGKGGNESEIVIGDGDDYTGLGEMTVGDATGNDDTDSSTVNGNDDSSNSGSDSSGKVNTNNDWLKDIPKKLQGTTVTFAVWGDENATEYAKVAKLFTKKTKINVKWVTYNEEKYVSTIVEQNAAGKGPDIVICNVTFPSVLEVVQELPSIFNVNDGFWDPRVTEQFSVKGKNYLVNSYNSPFLAGGLFCFYNKQIFSNNNITSPQDYVDQGNWTMETLEKCLREANAKGFDGGTVQPNALWTVTGADLLNYNPSTGTFTSGLKDASQKSDIVYALKFSAKLRKDGIISNMPLSNFASGNMAIAITGNFGMKYNGWFKGMSPSALGVVDMPSTYNGKKANFYGAQQRAYGIGKDAKNIEGAYYFLKFFLDINNYDEADADIFLNKNIERFFKETYLPNYKKRSFRTEYSQNPLSLVGSPWTFTSAGTWSALFDSTTVAENIEPDLMARANILENAAKKATEKVQNSVK